MSLRHRNYLSVIPGLVTIRLQPQSARRAATMAPHNGFTDGNEGVMWTIDLTQWTDFFVGLDALLLHSTIVS